MGWRTGWNWAVERPVICVRTSLWRFRTLLELDVRVLTIALAFRVRTSGTSSIGIRRKRLKHRRCRTALDIPRWLACRISRLPPTPGGRRAPPRSQSRMITGRMTGSHLVAVTGPTISNSRGFLSKHELAEQTGVVKDVKKRHMQFRHPAEHRLLEQVGRLAEGPNVAAARFGGASKISVFSATNAARAKITVRRPDHGSHGSTIPKQDQPHDRGK